jgi:hypothetical protein
VLVRGARAGSGRPGQAHRWRLASNDLGKLGRFSSRLEWANKRLINNSNLQNPSYPLAVVEGATPQKVRCVPQYPECPHRSDTAPPRDHQLRARTSAPPPRTLRTSLACYFARAAGSFPLVGRNSCGALEVGKSENDCSCKTRKRRAS